MQLLDLVWYLNDYLDVERVRDYSSAYNGLQVDGRAEVRRIAGAVDACQATIEAAVAGGADLLIVHHGLFWGATAPVVGPYHRRLAALLRSDLALYSCHLPLDAHPEVGNNHVLARHLGFAVGGLFGEDEGVPLGVWADVDVTRDELAARVAAALGVKPLVIATGPEVVRRVGIVTGGAGTWAGKAALAGCDTLVTGEGPHHSYFDFEEQGLNGVFAGHYATETVGVKALCAHLEKQFALQTFFIDHPTGL